jgi:hypothetical protein
LTFARKAGALPSRARPNKVRAVVYKEELAADKTLKKAGQWVKQNWFFFSRDFKKRKKFLLLPCKRNSVNNMSTGIDTTQSKDQCE